MLKGSKSGTALMNAFVQLATKGDKLSDIGVRFDPSQPLDFIDVMTQLHNIYGDQALSLNNLQEIMETFGRRGGRAAAQLIVDFDRWKKSMNDAESNFDGFAEKMKKEAEDNLPASWNKLWAAIKGGAISSMETAGLQNYFDVMAKGIANSTELQDRVLTKKSNE
jgi:hypothetical protein